MQVHSSRSSTGRPAAPAALAAALAALLSGCVEPMRDQAAVVRAPGAPTPLIGAFVPAVPWDDLHAMRLLEDALGWPFDVTHWFTSWDAPFEAAPVEAVLAGGRVPLISWQPDAQPVADIARGAHDDYVRSWARGVATAPGLVYIRPFPEMNGDWVPWNGDPDALRSAWRRIAAIFRDEGADNVRWVFGPNVTDEPRTADNAMERYYPGHDVVDVLALSGYNWGATRPAIGWRDFETIFRTGYDRLTTLGPQDVWLAEVASAEDGGDKSAWVHDMFARVDAGEFPRLGALVWFNERKEADWRIESSPASLEAFRTWAVTSARAGAR